MHKQLKRKILDRVSMIFGSWVTCQKQIAEGLWLEAHYVVWRNHVCNVRVNCLNIDGTTSPANKRLRRKADRMIASSLLRAAMA